MKKSSGNLEQKLLKYIQNLQLYHHSSFDLFISPSNIVNSGLGVFTNSFIPKNTLIDGYYGEYIEGFPGGEYFFKIDQFCGINAINTPRCYMAMLNDANHKTTLTIGKGKKKKQISIPHEFNNNCEFISDENNLTVSVYSIVDIQPESELFISYGDLYWSN